MKTNVYDSDYLFNLGVQIKKLRQNRDISQQQLADKIGIKKSTITRIELGQTNSSICVFHAIAKSLEMKMKDIFDF